MTILLINNNPVVSRLLSLCTRSEDMILEKVSSIDEASTARYDVLFVDEGSCEGDVAYLSTQLDVGKKIYLSYSDEPMAGFDKTITKPFLPSQITEVLSTVEVREVGDEEVAKEPIVFTETEEVDDDRTVPSIFPLSTEETDAIGKDEEREEETSMTQDISPEVLNRDEIEKIKALLDMDEDEPEVLELNEESYESRKIEVIKEQLIADGLEILEEEEIVDALSKEKEKKDKKKKKSKQFTQDEWSAIEDAIEDAIKQLKPKKIKKLLKGKEIEVKIELKGKR